MLELGKRPLHLCSLPLSGPFSGANWLCPQSLRAHCCSRSCNPRMGILSPSATFKAKVVLSLTPGNKAVSKTEQDQAFPSVLGATPAVPKADS